jgi:diguanylate cyclase (GGDEF)-like protein
MSTEDKEVVPGGVTDLDEIDRWLGVVTQFERQLEAVNEELRRKNEELRLISITDGLTGLHNRRHVLGELGELDREISRHRRTGAPLSILLMDIDHFKTINDTAGHLAGDAVLVAVAACLKAQLRSCDLAARYGGEEFLAVLPETDAEGARLAAERIRSAIAAMPLAALDDRRITISIGCGSFPGVSPLTADERIRLVDEALYRAKESGRNRVEQAIIGG